jgi:hypothetical protein
MMGVFKEIEVHWRFLAVQYIWPSHQQYPLHIVCYTSRLHGSTCPPISVRRISNNLVPNCAGHRHVNLFRTYLVNPRFHQHRVVLYRCASTNGYDYEGAWVDDKKHGLGTHTSVQLRLRMDESISLPKYFVDQKLCNKHFSTDAATTFARLTRTPGCHRQLHSLLAGSSLLHLLIEMNPS